MKIHSVMFFFVFVLSGCAAHERTEMRDTQACQSYRMMATAPLDPISHEALRQKCVKSCTAFRGFSYSETPKFWSVCVRDRKT